MADRSGVSRRRLIELLSASSLSGLAGCGGRSNQLTDTDTPTDPGSSETSTATTAVSTDTPTDDTNPNISDAKAETTEQKGLLQFELSASDNNGLAEALVSSPTESISNTFEGEQKITIQDTIEGPPGSVSEIDFRVTDEAGNEAAASSQAYTRRTSVTEPGYLNLGVHYLLHPESFDWCDSASPEVGKYRKLRARIVNQHVDQLQGAGINRIVTSVNDVDDLKAVNTITSSALGQSITVQFRLGFIDWFSEGSSIQDQAEVVKNQIEQQSNYDTYEGRPVISLPHVTNIRQEGGYGDIWDEILSKTGGVDGFVEELRTGLAIDSTDPYLIGEVWYPSETLYRDQLESDSDYLRLLEHLDGIRNTFNIGNWDEEQILGSTFSNFQSMTSGLNQFAVARDMDYIPLIVPGFLKAPEDCPSATTALRNDEMFRSLLQLAGNATTNGRALVESFNDWEWGTHIEAGCYAGKTEGRTLLDTVSGTIQQKSFEPFDERSVYHVSPDGANWNPGTEDRPLETIQQALNRALPGSEIKVHPGEYFEAIETVRPGTPNSPISITGPEDAIIRGNKEDFEVFRIRHSHIHVHGLTFDGLQDPEHPDDIQSYNGGEMIICRPPSDSTEYLRNLEIKPEAVGNSQKDLIKVVRSENVEIGEFRICGIAGARFIVGDQIGHNAEILYIGSGPGIQGGSYVWDTPDKTNNIHIHHIDNSAGHTHGDLVDLKPEISDVTVEYCTDREGGFATDESHRPAIVLGGRNLTVRYCDIANVPIPIAFDGTDAEDLSRNNSAYHNRLHDYSDRAIAFLGRTDPGEHDVICGNQVDGPTEGSPSKSCPRDIPGGDGIGHLGGDSPWK